MCESKSVSVIEALGVSKGFARQVGPQTLVGRLLELWRRGRGEEKTGWALKDVSLQVKSGETLGIIGANGAGKSTLLKVLSGITAPTKGKVAIRGRIVALLEAGAGLHPDLTGRENIFLAGCLLGLSRRQIRERFDDIVHFAELGTALDQPLRSYSSGMVVRLGFAVAAHSEPKILFLDEVLAVGDAAFQRKSLERILRFKRDGTAILFVSHQLDHVMQLADRVMWLDGGEVRNLGSAGEVIRDYLRGLIHTTNRVAPTSDTGHTELGPAEITDVRLLDNDGGVRSSFQIGEAVSLRVRFLLRERVEVPVFGIAVYRGDGLYVFGTNTNLCGVTLPALQGFGEMEIRVDPLLLSPGTYHVSLGITTLGGGRLALRQFACEFSVFPTERSDSRGVAHLPCRWNLVSLADTLVASETRQGGAR